MTVTKRRRGRGTNPDNPGSRGSTKDFSLDDEFEFRYTVTDCTDMSAPNPQSKPSTATTSDATASPRDERQEAQKASQQDDEIAEIFVNLGRSHGIHSEDLLQVLVNHKVPKNSVAHVVVRQHHSFVGIRRGHYGETLAALDGAQIAGRFAHAEPAKSTRS